MTVVTQGSCAMSVTMEGHAGRRRRAVPDGDRGPHREAASGRAERLRHEISGCRGGTRLEAAVGVPQGDSSVVGGRR